MRIESRESSDLNSDTEHGGAVVSSSTRLSTLDSSHSLLSIDNLSIAFGDTQVVKNVSLTVARGEVLAIVGESGSGKSLTAQSILQLLPGNAKTSGSITLDTNNDQLSRNLLSLTEREITHIRGRDVGMIFQEPMTALNPLHPIDKQMVESYCWHYKISPKTDAAKQKLLQLYAAVGLQHLASRGVVYPHQLSGGERQRVMIAMAIANDPALLIADEPTTALDVTLVGQILALLKELQTAKNMGMIFITHDLLMVQQIADRVAVMKAGEIVETGAVKTVFSNPQHPYTKMLLAASPSGSPAPIASDAKEVLSCQNLSVAFPVKSPILRRTLRVVEALKNTSFTLHAGETLGVVGESGSGKSSLGYALLRLVKSEGPIVFLGKRLDHLASETMRAARKDLQIVFQDPYSSLNPRMSVREIIAEGLQLHEPRATNHDSRLVEILTKVGLTPDMLDRYPHEFSGGQRQRIAIARAMVLKPALVVLDEPTSALDMTVQKQVLDLLKSLQSSHNVSYIFISHDLRTVRAMAHQVLVLKRGEVVEQGRSETIFAAPQHDYTKKLFAAAFSAAI
jgi:microcin C transport system ATP-binding protein